MAKRAPDWAAIIVEAETGSRVTDPCGCGSAAWGQPGTALAIGYTLVATYEQHGVNPIDYLTDVLTRVHEHPAAQVTDLLPQHWKPPDG